MTLMQIRYILFFLLFFLTQLQLIAQVTLREAILQGQSLEVEWVQQGHLLINGSEASAYPVYPDRLKNGEWERRVGFKFYPTKTGKIEGKIIYINSLNFPLGNEWNKPDVVAPRTRPSIFDSRFQDLENPEKIDNHLQYLIGLSFEASCDTASLRALHKEFEESHKNTLRGYGYDEAIVSRARIGFPNILLEANWLDFYVLILRPSMATR